MVIGDDDARMGGMPGAGMMLYVQNCCRNQTAVQTVFSRRSRGTNKIFVKKDVVPIQTTNSFLNVLCRFLFARKVENEIYTFKLINIGFVISIEAQNCSINNISKNRKS